MTLPTLIVEAGFAGGASTSTYLHLNDAARGLLDTGTLAGESAVWEDISAYAHRISAKRGANRTGSPILRYEAGTCTIELDNSDRRFDPTNLDGPYVSAGVTQVTPMRAVRVRATWNGVTYDLFRGFADEWRIDYSGPNYSRCVLTCTDATKALSNYDRTAVASTGAGDDTGARIDRILDSISWSSTDRIIATGDTTLQATTLADNAWTEMLLASDTEVGETYVDSAGRVVFRNRQATMEEIRSIAANAVFGDSPVTGVDTTINMCQNPSVETDLTGWEGGGTVPPTVARSSAQAKYGTYSVLTTWGAGGLLPLVKYTATGLTAGQTYTVSVWVYVPTGSPDVTLWHGGVGSGTSTSTKDAWTRLTVTSISTISTWDIQIWPNSSPAGSETVYVDGLQIELGATATAYCDGDQTYCEWDGTDHASTSRRLPELPYADAVIDYDDSTIANLVKATRSGGSVQTAQDTTSQELYLTHTYERSDLLMQSDSVASDWAYFMLYQAKDPELRFSSVTIRPLRDETYLFPQALGRRMGDRIRIIRRPPGGGSISREVFIRGVEHTIDPGSWQTTFTLQSATKWAFLILDHGTLGVLDSNALAY